MPSLTHISTDYPSKLASRLARAFESPIAIADCSSALERPSSELTCVSGMDEQLAQSLRTELDCGNYLVNDVAGGIARFSCKSLPSILAIDISEHQDRSAALYVVDPNVSEAMLTTLVNVIRNELELERHISRPQSSDAAPPPEEYLESYIEQVTQDFEELTWLRQSHRFADLYSVNASAVEVAHACVASMAPVIQAENLLFLETMPPEGGMSFEPTKLHLLAGPKPQCSTWQIDQWVHSLSEEGRTSPILLDSSRDTLALEQFPFIRNCMLTAVAKGERIYGWLIALNKIIPTNQSAEPANPSKDWNRSRFGTFEAGLLTTAANMLASQASNSELFSIQESLTKGLVLAIINAIDAKDCYTAGHSERVASFARCIAARMGVSEKECEQIHMAGLLHDVGKIGIPDSILKKPGKLTDEEYDAIKAHPFIGHFILRHLTSIDYVLPGVLLHHEAFDGSGYPQGQKGEEIPLMARILAVSDAFDAMTSTRPYRTALTLEKATSILLEDNNKTWDRRIVDALLECIAEGEIAPGVIASTEMGQRIGMPTVPSAIDTVLSVAESLI